MMYQTMINVYISVNDLIPLHCRLFKRAPTQQPKSVLIFIRFFMLSIQNIFLLFVYLLVLHVRTPILILYEFKYRLSCFGSIFPSLSKFPSTTGFLHPEKNGTKKYPDLQRDICYI